MYIYIHNLYIYMYIDDYDCILQTNLNIVLQEDKKMF